MVHTEEFKLKNFTKKASLQQSFLHFSTLTYQNHFYVMCKTEKNMKVIRKLNEVFYLAGLNCHPTHVLICEYLLDSTIEEYE